MTIEMYNILMVFTREIQNIRKSYVYEGRFEIIICSKARDISRSEEESRGEEYIFHATKCVCIRIYGWIEKRERRSHLESFAIFSIGAVPEQEQQVSWGQNAERKVSVIP
jgi:hypothetical protein